MFFDLRSTMLVVLQRAFFAYASLVLLLLLSPDARAQSATTIADATFRSVVLVTMEDAKGRPVAMASGFVIRDDLVVTNFHVIKEAFRGHVRIVGEQAAYAIAGVASMNRAKDLAVLKITGIKAPSVLLGTDADVRVGDKIYAVGNPLGLEGTFSDGIISGIRRAGSFRLLQITAPISPGSSGGPILNASGKVIGIAVSTLREGQNINFAIPVSELEPLVLNVGRLLPLPRSAINANTATPTVPPVPQCSASPPPSGSPDAKGELEKLRVGAIQNVKRYRATLVPILAMFERRLERETELAAARRELYERGAMDESELRAGRAAVIAAQKDVDQTRREIEEADRALRVLDEAPNEDASRQPQRRR
jgi:S1-C subfamily serine protease